MPTEAVYYRPDGTPALREIYADADGKLTLRAMQLVSREGKIIHAFASRAEAITQWLGILFNDETQEYFIINDRTNDYAGALEKLQAEEQFDLNKCVIDKPLRGEQANDAGAWAKLLLPLLNGGEDE